MGWLRFLYSVMFLCLVGCMPLATGGSRDDDDGGASDDGGAERGGERTDGEGRGEGPQGGEVLTDGSPSGENRDGGGFESPRPAPLRDGGPPVRADFGRPRFDDGGGPRADASPRGDAGDGRPCNDRLPPGEVEPGRLEPASVITELFIVPSARVAADVGCEVVGHNRGTGLSAIEDLLRLNVQNLRLPPGSNRVDFLHLSNWRPGASLSDRLPALSWHQGVARGPIVESERRDATFSGIDLRCPTLRAAFQGPFAIFATDDINGFNFILEHPRIKADIFPYVEGFESVGTVTGYVTLPGLIRMVAELQESCAGDDRPDVCNQLEPILNGPAEVAATSVVLPILGGADARVDEEGNATDGCGAACNAVSVCLSFRGDAALRTFPQ